MYGGFKNRIFQLKIGVKKMIILLGVLQEITRRVFNILIICTNPAGCLKSYGFAYEKNRFTKFYFI